MSRRAVPVETDPIEGLMAKLRAFEQESARSETKCSVCKLPERLRTFIATARKAGTRLSHITKVVNGEGHNVAENTIGRHLLKQCKGQRAK